MRGRSFLQEARCDWLVLTVQITAKGGRASKQRRVPHMKSEASGGGLPHAIVKVALLVV